MTSPDDRDLLTGDENMLRVDAVVAANPNHAWRRAQDLEILARELAGHLDHEVKARLKASCSMCQGPANGPFYYNHKPWCTKKESMCL